MFESRRPDQSLYFQHRLESDDAAARKSTESLFMQRIVETSGIRMPLDGKPLADGEIAMIRAWIVSERGLARLNGATWLRTRPN